MPRLNIPRIPTSVLVLALVWGLTACAGSDVENEVASDAAQRQLAAISAELAAARWDYESGLERLASGNPSGTALVEAASERLKAAADRCAALTVCSEATIGRSFEMARRWRPRGLESVRKGVSRERESDLDRAMREQIDARLDPHIRAALNEWLTWRRPELADAWRHYQALRSSMLPIYQEAGLPEALLFAQLATESGGKVHAYSSAGAVGPLQFMDATAMRYGLRSVDGFDARLDPVAATHANVAYVRDHLRRFDGDFALVLAAYNGGETRLRRLLRRNPGKDFWDAEIYRALPSETRAYVPLVLAAAWLFFHPDEHGLGLIDSSEPVVSFTLPDSISIGELAICMGDAGHPEGWFRTLRNLNPRVDPSRRLAAGSMIALPASLVGIYARQCADGHELRAQARRLHDAEYGSRTDMLSHVVRPGDTLESIAERHPCVSSERLAALNDLAQPIASLRQGQRLDVPACP